MSDELEGEIEMVLSMFPDECQVSESNKLAIVVQLPFRFVLEITLPPHGYPETCHPSLFPVSGPNAQLLSEFKTELQKRVKEEVALGFSQVPSIIMLAQQIAEELEEMKGLENLEKQAQEEALQEAINEEVEQARETSLQIWSGEVITDRKSRFLAHIAEISSVEEVMEAVAYVRSKRHISSAAHPAIYAYRFRDVNGVLHQDADDDGEGGASIKMMFLLDQMDIDGYVVTVTRWWGGILLGPDRFKHIMMVTKDILLTIPDHPRKDKNKSKNNKKKN
ncbi:hypothetical protein AGDE_01286 [Angomonas deanei]|nr:hypothetical protein AGDE_01286 [Angomonas deanei]|eukprot:EPY42637.1 hypothetical protein AGDE_01286 [Angomonas deanei]